MASGKREGPASVNFCVLGRKETALEFGRAGTSSDITIHDKKARDIVRTWVVATGFPEKIPPLFHVISMSEYVIFHVDALDRFTGEQIVALDTLGRRDGILCHTYEVDEGRLDSMIRGTVVENYRRVDASELAQAVDALPPLAGDPSAGAEEAHGRPAEVAIDHSFDVKGVGAVILGRVTSGSISQYDTLTLHPSGSEVLVKSIQMHDDPVGTASCPARVGLAVKGPKPEDVRRGDILSAAGNDAIVDSADLVLDYTPNRFYKAGLSKKQGCIVSVGLQARAATVSGVSRDGDSGGSADDDGGDDGSDGGGHSPPGPCRISLSLAKPVTYHYGDTAVILRPEAEPIRIAGSGRIIPR